MWTLHSFSQPIHAECLLGARCCRHGLPLVNKRCMVNPCPSEMYTLERQINMTLINTCECTCTRMYTHSMIFQKCWYVSVRMRDLTLGRGVRGQVRKTFLSSRVENGRLRTWVTEMMNLTVSLLIL